MCFMRFPAALEAKLMSGRAMLSTVKVGLTNFDLANMLPRKLLWHFSALIFSQNRGKVCDYRLQISLNLDFSGLSSSLNHDRSNAFCTAFFFLNRKSAKVLFTR